MRGRDIASIFLVVLSLSSIVCEAAGQSRQLVIEVTITVSSIVEIKGRVVDNVGNGVPQALVSIQVNDPSSNSYQIAVLQSGPEGGFNETFGLSPHSLYGNYTAYFTATKEGYAEGRVTKSFVVGGDFTVTILQAVEPIKPGQNASFDVNLIGYGGFNQTVHFALGSAIPSANASFTPDSARPNATVSLRLSTSPETPPANYTVLVLASSPDRTRFASSSLSVTAPKPNTFQSWPYFALGVALLVAVAFLVLRNRPGGVVVPYDEEVTQEDLVARKELVRLEELRAAGMIAEKEYKRLKSGLEKRLRTRS